MIQERLKQVLQVIAEEAKQILLAVLDSDIGINKKVGVNTLSNSRLYNEVLSDTNDIDVVRLLVNDYIVFIESGRMSGSWPPPNVIAEWCQRKGLPSDNSTVYLICRSIYMYGIAPRPVFDGFGGVWQMVDEYWDGWADSVADAIVSELDEIFNE